MRKPAESQNFTFTKWGNFGTFQANKSLPVEYILTTFSISELEKLSFAREIKPDVVDFELIMQRDINVSRVEKEIVKYLNPDKTSAEIESKPTFFPPLLAAVVPVKAKKMQPWLPTEEVKREADKYAHPMIQRKWGNQIQISFYESEEQGTGIQYINSADGSTLWADPFPAKIEIKEAPKYGQESGIRLVVFDGQHRLCALQKLANAHGNPLSGVMVPVCIVLAPNSTISRSETSTTGLLSVPKVFRSLFVDVNKNAVAVGGHFNTLLSDSSIGSISSRLFCEQVLEQYGLNGLALVEWNIASKKDATQIKRNYSLTSIGVIELALAKSLGQKGKRGLVKHILQLGLVESDLYPRGSEDDYPQVEWDRFSASQKDVLEKQIRNTIIKQGLLRIFFETEEFKKAKTVFDKIISVWQESYEHQEGDFEATGAVIQEVLEYDPIADDNRSFRVASTKFANSVYAQYISSINEIIRFAVFQRAMIDSWVKLIDVYRPDDNIGLNQITSAYIALLNHVLDKDNAIFSPKIRRYMKHAIFWADGNIKPTEASKTGLGNLILAALGNSDIATKFLREIGLASQADEIRKIKEFGMGCASKFATHFQSERMNDFISTYPTDFSIPLDDREELRELHEKIDKLKRAVRDKQETRETLNKAQDEFDREVNKYVQADVDLALSDLKTALAYEVDIITDGQIDEVVEED